MHRIRLLYQKIKEIKKMKIMENNEEENVLIQLHTNKIRASELSILCISRRVSHVPTVLIVARFFFQNLTKFRILWEKSEQKRTAKRENACNVSTGDLAKHHTQRISIEL